MSSVVTSEISAVTVHRSGAVVTRRAPIDTSVDEVFRIEGLPLVLDDGSVRVMLSNGAEPVDVSVELSLPPLGETLVPRDKAELLAVTQQLEALEEDLELLDAELQQLQQLTLALPGRIEEEPPRAAPINAWLELKAWTAQQEKRLHEERLQLVREQRKKNEERQRIERALNEARALSGTATMKVTKSVTFRIAGDVRGTLEALVQYRVRGARWAPSYVVRVAKNGESAALSLRALVVQSTGEPWQRVELSLSTAELLHVQVLPELKSMRIGRAVADAQRSGFREPPADTDTLFSAFDDALRGLPRPSVSPIEIGELPRGENVQGVGSGVARAKKAKPVAPPKPQNMPAPPPPPAPMPMMQPSAMPMSAPSFGGPPMSASMPAPAPAMRSAAPGRRMEMDMAKGMAGGAAMSLDLDEASEDAMPQEPSPEPATTHALKTLRFAELAVADSFGGADRGKLRPRPVEAHAQSAVGVAMNAAANVDHMTFGATPVPNSGMYAYRYHAEAPVSVPADGRIHNVPLLVREATVETTCVIVPRESNDAVRIAEMKNPLAVPLLEGQADVYLEDEFLVTTTIRHVPAGGTISVGLGVEPAIKVARNTSFEEKAEGMLGGSLSLEHEVRIEVASRLGVPVNIEVRERVPVKQAEQKEIEIDILETEPRWEKYDQRETTFLWGGYRFLFKLEAQASRTVRFKYRVRIDKKLELRGGNRRESY